MPGISSHYCKCHNMSHGHGFPCSHPIPESSEVCDACVVKGGPTTYPGFLAENVSIPMPTSLLADGINWNYPQSALANVIYTAAGLESYSGLFQGDQEKVRSL